MELQANTFADKAFAAMRGIAATHGGPKAYLISELAQKADQNNFAKWLWEEFPEKDDTFYQHARELQYVRSEKDMLEKLSKYPRPTTFGFLIIVVPNCKHQYDCAACLDRAAIVNFAVLCSPQRCKNKSTNHIINRVIKCYRVQHVNLHCDFDPVCFSGFYIYSINTSNNKCYIIC